MTHRDLPVHHGKTQLNAKPNPRTMSLPPQEGMRTTAIVVCLWHLADALESHGDADHPVPRFVLIGPPPPLSRGRQAFRLFPPTRRAWQRYSGVTFCGRP